MPEISVIITTHDRLHSLRRAVESARAASTREIEVVLVDDASTEEMAHLYRSLPGINYVRAERNLGVAGARNLGIRASCGEFLSFLDDDDLRLPGTLDAQLAALSAAPEACLIYGQALIGRQDGSATDVFYPTQCPQGDAFWELLAQNFIPCGTALFRRSSLNRVGLLDESIAGIDDWDLWVRLAEHYPVLALEQPVLIWRQSTPASGQGSSNAARMVKLATRQFRGRWLRLPRAVKSSVKQRRESSRRFSNNMTRHLIWEAARSTTSGQLLRAQANLLAALRHHPAALARVLSSPASFRFLLRRAPKELRLLNTAARRSSAPKGEHKI